MLYSGPPPLPLPPIFQVTTTVTIPMLPAGAMPLVHLYQRLCDTVFSVSDYAPTPSLPTHSGPAEASNT